MQAPDHAAVRWDLLLAVIGIIVTCVGAVIGPNRTGRVWLAAACYVFMLAAYFIYTAPMHMSLIATAVIAVVFTGMIVALAWSPVRRFLHEGEAGSRVPSAAPSKHTETNRPGPPTNPQIEQALKREMERDAERLREALATGNIPAADPMREHVQALVDELALMPPVRSVIISVERFATIAHAAACRWSNETPTQRVRIVHGTDTQFALTRGPVAATLTRNGDEVDVEIGSLDHRMPYKTVPLTERDAEEIGKEIGMRMRA